MEYRGGARIKEMRREHPGMGENLFAFEQGELGWKREVRLPFLSPLLDKVVKFIYF